MEKWKHKNQVDEGHWEMINHQCRCQYSIQEPGVALKHNLVALTELLGVEAQE